MMINLIFELARKKVIREANHWTQALQWAAQITWVIQISNSCQAHSCISIGLARLIPLFNYFNTLASFFVESTVCDLALSRTVKDSEALAVIAKLSLLLAVITFRNYHKLLVRHILCLALRELSNLWGIQADWVLKHKDFLSRRRNLNDQAGSWVIKKYLINYQVA